MTRGLAWAAILSLSIVVAACFWQDEDDQSDVALRREKYTDGGLDQPVAMALLPDGRVLVTEKNTGNVRLIEADGQVQAEPVISFTVASEGEWGLLGIALHPDFEANQLVYVYYTEPVERRARPVIARFELRGDRGSEPTVLIGDLPQTAVAAVSADADTFPTSHVGGNIHFGPDDLLYVAIGDFGVFDPTAADPAELTGKILRFTVDGEPAPADGLPQRADPRVFAYGLRNPFDFDYGPEGEIFAIENGPDSCDEINLISAGQDYGWPSPRVSTENCERRDGEPAIAYLAREDSEAHENGSTVGPSSLLYLEDGFAYLDGPGLVICEVNTRRLRYLPLDGDAINLEESETLADDCFTDVIRMADGSLLYTTLSSLRRLTIAD